MSGSYVSLDYLLDRVDEIVQTNHLRPDYMWFTPNEVKTLAKEAPAADAIEELSMRLHGDEAAIAGMKREIERMVVAGKPRWIPVTERLPGPYVPVIVALPDERRTYEAFMTKDEGDDAFYVCALHAHRRATAWMPLPEPPKEEE